MNGAAIDEVVGRAVQSGSVPGAVAIVGGDHGVTFLHAYGRRDDAAAMEEDTIFRIASFTKAVAAIAVLQLVERGVLDLDVPVGSILPAFDDLQVLEGFDGDRPRLRPPSRRATLRHLMTHTSGLAYDALNARIARFGEVTGVPMPSSGLKSCFRTPLLFDPGDSFQYGMSTDWTGQVIEAVSGMALDVYFQREIFAPLGLQDIGFTLSEEQRGRLAPVYLRGDEGGFSVIDFEWPADPEFHSAGHGLYSSAADYLTIQRLLLGGGAVDGTRLLRQESVAAMFSDQLGGVRIPLMPTARPDFTYDFDLGPNVTWGLDIMLTANTEEGMRPAGSAGWCGTFNDFYWIDPVNRVVAALHMQYLPLFEPTALTLFRAFEHAVYRALEQGRPNGSASPGDGPTMLSA